MGERGGSGPAVPAALVTAVAAAIGVAGWELAEGGRELPEVAALLGLSGLVVVLAGAHLRALALGRRERRRRAGARTVADRRVAERLLAAERLTHLGHWEHDLIGEDDYWSAETRQILGLPPKLETDGLTSLLAAIHPEDRDAERSARILALAGVTPYNVRARVLRPDRTLRHVHLRAEVLRGERGDPVKLIGTILDVTDRVSTEQRLRDSEERYRKTFEAAQDALILVDRATGAVIDANDAATRLYGYPRERLLGLPWSALAAADQPTTGPARHVRCDGGLLFVDLSEAEAQFSGMAVGVIAVRDVTARKQAEVKLRLLTRAIEQSPLSVIITDREGRIVYVNPHFVTATGYSADEVVGQDPSLFKSGYTTPSEYRRLWATIADGRVWQGEFHNRRKSGEMHWESASIAPVRDDHGVITHFVAVKEDITRRKQAEIELLAAKERAEAASTSKSQFLAAISHELRTPLNAIMGFSEVLANAPNTLLAADRFTDYARHIHTNGGHLLNLINDLLDMAEAEAGTFDLDEAFVDVEEVIFAVTELVRSRAEAGCLVLTNSVPPDLPLLQGDDRAVRQILINLLANAIKFTPEGGRVTVTAGLDDKGLMVLSVSDTGIGIAEADIAKALEPFGQIDNALSRRHDGTGLGLPLCRSLVERHGGHLAIASTPGVGTVVTVRFPRDRIVVPGTAAWPRPEA